MQVSFNSLEANLMVHTTIIMDQISSFERSLNGKLDTIICNQQRFDIYPNIRKLQAILNSFSSANTIQKELRLNDTAKVYRSQFEDILVTDLLRAIRGDSSSVSPSKSLVEVEMECFDRQQVCTDQYHKKLRTKEAELLALYFRTKQFEKLLIANFPNVLHKTRADLDQTIEKDLNSIVESREKSACPAFTNEHFRGGGCNSRSTYKGQEIGLTNLCALPNTSPIYISMSSNGER